MPLSAPLPTSTVSLLQGVVLLKYGNLVALTILFYDFISTIPDEIRLIWSSEWRAGKVLYILSRYSAPIDMISFLIFWFRKDLNVQDCKVFFSIGCWFATVGALVAGWTLASRTWAIWEKSKVIMTPLVVMILVFQIAGIIATNMFMNSLDWSLSPFSSFSSCYFAVPKHNLLFLVYTLIMSVELVVLVLTVWKGVTIWRTSQRSNLMKVLYRDGVFYFAVLFVVSVSNVALCVTAPSALHEFFLIEPQRVLHSICSCRIILNLRDANSRNTLSDFEPAIAGTLSPMRFGNATRPNIVTPVGAVDSA